LTPLVLKPIQAINPALEGVKFIGAVGAEYLIARVGGKLVNKAIDKVDGKLHAAKRADTPEKPKTEDIQPNIEEGSLVGANFAQNKIRSDRAFSAEGKELYSQLSGEEINTVDDLVGALRRGSINPSQIPIDYVDINGVRLILNTRTSTALEQASIPREMWYGRNQTGKIAYQDPLTGTAKTYDDLAADQLTRNKLPPTGADKLQ